MKNKKLLSIVLLPSLMCMSCTKLNSDKNLYEVYKDYFSIGAAINEYVFDSPLLSHFNSITAENAMKWISVHPSLDTYNYTDADKYISLAQEQNKQVRGHALVWHNEKSITSDVFVNNGVSRSKEEVIQIEKDHIENVITHFSDSVYCWDVCNEVIDDGTSPINEDGSNIYRQSNWYNACGGDFIKEAYIEADRVLVELGIRDKVKLFYNDYDNTKEVKRDKTIAMLNWLIDEGVPIDGVGLQCHYHLGSFNPEELETAIIMYSELGLDVQITEFDVDIYDKNISEYVNYEYYMDVPQEIIDVQATIYDRAFQIFRRHKDKISNVTFWGVSDNICYMNDNEDYGYRTNYPFLFDVLGEKKPAFYVITNYKEEQ